jgi:RimJ/RimL family protein N-acetyltransferase
MKTLKVIEQYIFLDDKEIGYIRAFLPKSKIVLWQIEYGLNNKKYYNKKIMSKELAKFMKKNKEIEIVVAMIKDGNIASQRVAEKCNFFLMPFLKKDDINFFVYSRKLKIKR